MRCNRLSSFVASVALAAVSFGAVASDAAAHAGCRAISFRVLHNDSAGGVSVPAGTYRISSATMRCRTASQQFKLFITRYPRYIPEWNAKQISSGHVAFAQDQSDQSFGARRVGS